MGVCPTDLGKFWYVAKDLSLRRRHCDVSCFSKTRSYQRDFSWWFFEDRETIWFLHPRKRRGPWSDHANLDVNARAADSSATPGNQNPSAGNWMGTFPKEGVVHVPIKHHRTGDIIFQQILGYLKVMWNDVKPIPQRRHLHTFANPWTTTARTGVLAFKFQKNNIYSMLGLCRVHVGGMFGVCWAHVGPMLGLVEPEFST